MKLGAVVFCGSLLATGLIVLPGRHMPVPGIPGLWPKMPLLVP